MKLTRWHYGALFVLLLAGVYFLLANYITPTGDDGWFLTRDFSATSADGRQTVTLSYDLNGTVRFARRDVTWEDGTTTTNRFYVVRRPAFCRRPQFCVQRYSPIIQTMIADYDAYSGGTLHH